MVVRIEDLCDGSQIGALMRQRFGVCSSSRAAGIMAGKLGIVCLCVGVLGNVLAGECFGQDEPILRTIERTSAQVPDAKTPEVKREKVSPKGEDTKPVHANAKGGKASQTLPQSDIELPKLTLKDAQKKALAKRLETAMGEKALRNTAIGVHIVDLDTGEVVYQKNADKGLKPASNTKLVTTAAAFGILGPDHQFESALLARGKIVDGVLKGDLQLHIDHDFTWSTRFYHSGDVPLIGMISQLKARGIRKITGRVIVSGYVVYGGTATGTLDTGAHLRRVSNQFAALLKKNKIAHAGMSVVQNSKRDGDVVATWRSPVLSEAAVPLNRASHNEYADMLMLALGSAKYGKNTYEAGAKAVKAWLDGIGLNTKGFKVHDGSGLSHDNRISASFFTSLISWVLQRSTFGREWAASLSISGYDGTYGGRLATDDAKGRVYAKSGTLRDVISGSGFMVNGFDGHTYAFSVVVNGNKNRKLTRQAIDRMIRPYLSDVRGVKMPAVPRVVSYRRESDGRVVVRWEAVKGAKGYRLYQSADGATWTPLAETKDLALIMPDTAAHIRLTAVEASGLESLPSLVFSYRPGKRVMTIVEEARCRSDEAMRPANRIVAHERPLASLIPAEWGVETVTGAVEAPQGLLIHSVACNGQIAWNPELLKARDDIPVIVDVVDAHLAEGRGGCAPESGRVLGCYGEPVITKDRRVGERKENTRLRKAAGTGSSRPSSVVGWKGSASLLEMDGVSVGAQQTYKSGGSLTILGVDLQGLDSQKTLDAVWKTLKIR